MLGQRKCSVHVVWVKLHTKRILKITMFTMFGFLSETYTDNGLMVGDKGLFQGDDAKPRAEAREDHGNLAKDQLLRAGGPEFITRSGW